MRLLLAEDDAMIGESVCRGLRQDGFAVDWVQDGRAAELALSENVHDLLLLDLGLPRKEGLEVLRGMRNRGDVRPVLIVTARDAVADRVAGLDAGADDYVLKPFEVRVRGVPVALSAREFALLEALLARPGAVMSRAQLEEKLYGWNEEVDSNAVEVHLHSLRRKLPPETIRNVRGVGWTIPRADAAARQR